MNDSLPPHTLHRFDDELRALHGKVVEMGELVLSQLSQALDALKSRDLPLAQAVVGRGPAVNVLEAAIDAEICAILAKRCPVAGDLRSVLAASKAAAHFARIADKALKLANFVAYPHGGEGQDGNPYPLDDIYTLGGFAVCVARAAVEAYERMDGARVKEVCELRGVLDQAFQVGLRRMMGFVQAEKTDVGYAVSEVLLMKALDRVGDHADNIASLVVYQIEGEMPGHEAPKVAGDFPLV